MGYSPVAQINESIDFDASSGKIQRQNLLINIREDSPQAAYDQYIALRKLILGSRDDSSDEKKADSINEKKIVETPMQSMMCDCGQEMMVREGSRGFFWGCQSYPECRVTKPITANKSVAKNVKTETDKQENDNSPVPQCPRHKIPMWIKARRTDGQLFFGCPMHDSKGCLETIQYPIPSKATVKVPSVTY